MQHKKIEKLHKENVEISTTGDEITNDFDLKKSKSPTQSTLKSQYKKCEELKISLESDEINNRGVSFDRLMIAVYLPTYADFISFKNFRLEDCNYPDIPASYYQDDMKRKMQLSMALHRYNNANANAFETSDLDYDDDFERLREEYTNEVVSIEDVAIENEDDYVTEQATPFEYSFQKKQIPYRILKVHVGLRNIFINRGNLVIDITGKWMAGNNVLGALNKDNIKDALVKIAGINVISFDVEKFIQVAQVFLCDMCVDLTLDSEEQVKKYINAVSSFAPLVSDNFKISKYKSHGITLQSKSQDSPLVICLYNKGEETVNSVRCSNKKTRYTKTLGKCGVNKAKKTLRLELHLKTFRDIRKALDFEEKTTLHLTTVLNAPASVILKEFEKFSATPKKLQDSISGFIEDKTGTTAVKLESRLAIERFIDLLVENNYDITLLKSHILTEYQDNFSKNELEKFIRRSSIERNILQYLVFRKPKTITIMLDILKRLYDYCSSNGDDNDAI